MMKKILIIALALMLALSLVACNKNKGEENDTNNGIIELDPTGTGNATGTGDPAGTDNPGNVGGNDTPGTPAEEIFTDLEQTIFIVADVASVRSEARIAEETLIAYTQKDTEFKSVAYSANWYKIEYTVQAQSTTEADTEAATDAETTEGEATSATYA